MKILAINTSSASGSIAIIDGNGRLVAEITSCPAGPHSRWLLKSVSVLLESVNHRIEEVGLFAADVGPGSFTGIRIGVSTIKGLAWPLNKKVAGVSSLKALALNLSYSGNPVCPMLDARKGEVYAALYRPNNGRMEELINESAIRPSELFDKINGLNAGPVVFLGSGLDIYGNEVIKNVKGAQIAPAELWHIRASNIAFLAREATPLAPEELSPVYLRKSEAELKVKAV